MTDCPRTGKVTYRTKKEALLARTKIRERIRGTRSKRRAYEHSPYRCKYCRLWHLTSTPP